MKFSALAIAALTTLAAAHLIPEDKKHHVIYQPVGAPHHPEHKVFGPGHHGKGNEKHHGVLPSAEGDNFRVIKIGPGHPHHPKPPSKHEARPHPIPFESPPYKGDYKVDHKHDHKPCCPYDKHHHRHDHKHDQKHCPCQKHEHKHDHKPCPYHKPDHKPCPCQKHDHKHDHKPCPCKHQHKPEHKPVYHKPELKPEHPKPEHPKPEHPKPEHPKPQHPHQPPKLEEECSPGTYACTYNTKSGAPGWKVCNAGGKWEYGEDCPPNTLCKFYEPSKSPYCVPRYYEFP
ncbi:unnamed protein product [Clonostachys rosea]|uniref:CBM1 domain-containing protein n=1 Tax=Bionectria ochroleuca TaxID=29856 RepID=A0ABY6TQJ1_BIOOC|nr:unnamed protein product [Clonostachys rosea]